MRDEERKKLLGEVFTPPETVQEMLDKLPPDSWTDHTKTFLDNSCGNGNFLVAILQRLLLSDPDPENALRRIYGVDLMQDNVDECRARMKEVAMPYLSEAAIDQILNLNIICADALKYHYRFDGTDPYLTAAKSLFASLFSPKKKAAGS